MLSSPKPKSVIRWFCILLFLIWIFALTSSRAVPSTNANAVQLSDHAKNNATVISTTVTIDVMIVYTPAARTATGGTTAMEALARLAVDETNIALANSQVNAQLRLVHTAEIAYTEAGLGNDLTCIYNSNCTALNSVRTMRDQFGADLVSIFVKDPNNGGGVANRMNALNAETPYSIVSYNWAVSIFAFAHEVGHSMGLCHEPTDVQFACPKDNFVPYANAYNDSTGAFSDIMGSTCTNCDRLALYSNPNVQFNGRPTGVVDLSDAARALNITAPIVANWRTSVVKDGAVYLPLIQSLVSSTSVVQLRGNVVDLHLDSTKVVSLDSSHIVTAGCDSSAKRLTLTLWTINGNGQINKGDSITDLACTDVALTPLGNQRIISLTLNSEQTSTGQPTGSLIVYDITNNKFARRKENRFISTAKYIGINALSNNRVVTIERSNDNKLYAGVSQILDDGSAQYLSGATGVSTSVVDEITFSTLDGDHPISANSRSDAGGLQVISYRVTNDGQISATSSRRAESTSAIQIVGITESLAATIGRDSGGKLRIDTWRVAAGQLGTTGITISDDRITAIAATKLSQGRLITAVRDDNGLLHVIVWNVGGNGSIFPSTRSNGGLVKTITSATALSPTRVVVVTTDQDNHLNLTLWDVTN